MVRGSAKAVLCSLFIIAPAWAEPVTIAALGDSLTQGYGLPSEEGFVPQLENWLQGQGADVRVLNAGVSGDTTAGGLSRIAWTLTPDVDAVIVALGGNDLLRGIDPSVSRANLAGILDVTQEAGLPVLLVGLPAPGNYGPDFQTEFDAIFPDLAERYGALMEPNFLNAIGSESLTEAAQFMQSDGIHPNAAGVAKIVGDLGPTVLDLVTQAQQP